MITILNANCHQSTEQVAGHSFDSFMHDKYSSFVVGFDFFLGGGSGERGVIKPSNAGFSILSVV